ncbi:MAG: C-GCAxxG-C-C family protein [Bilifractor sp.]
MTNQFLEEARKIRALTSPHYNCAQGVMIPFAEKKGYDTDKAFAIADGFGSGMRMGATCGAVTGSLMVLGMYGASDPQTISEFYRRFRENHDGITNCRDLLRTCAQKNEVQKNHCDGLVFECVEILTELLRERGLLES